MTGRPGRVTNQWLDQKRGRDTALGMLRQDLVFSWLTGAGTITAADNTYVNTAANVATASGSSTTFAAQPDWARALQYTSTNLAAGEVVYLTVIGRDIWDNQVIINEAINSNTTADFTQGYAFKALDAYSWVLSGTPGTQKVTIGPALPIGLPVRIAASTDIINVMETSGPAQDTTFTLSLPYQTITTASAPNGVKTWRITTQSTAGLSGGMID